MPEQFVTDFDPEMLYWFIAGIAVAAIVIAALVWRSINKAMRRGLAAFVRLVFSDK